MSRGCLKRITSAEDIAVSKSTYRMHVPPAQTSFGVRSKAMTCILNPLAISATRFPIAPVPITAMVLDCNSQPCSPSHENLNFRVYWSAVSTCRQIVSNRAKICFFSDRIGGVARDIADSNAPFPAASDVDMVESGAPCRNKLQLAESFQYICIQYGLIRGNDACIVVVADVGCSQ